MIHIFSTNTHSQFLIFAFKPPRYGNDWLCGICRTMRMDGIALKMGVLSERSEFRPFSNDGHSQRNGSFGRPPFS